jgi:uncharacterized Zn finger protein
MAVAKADRGARFDVDRLRELAGAKAFGRGEEYYEDGQVELLAVEPKRVVARVAGSEDYRTELKGSGKDIDGRCSCPAYTDWGFCKHMVAVGLAANAAPDSEAAGGGALSRIRDHLKTKSVDFLADMIVKLAEQDTRLFRSLELAAASSQDDDPKLEARLRKAIDGATRTADYIRYADAPDWAAAVDEVLGSIEALASGPRAALALKLAEFAIDRIEDVVGSIDDSEGHCGSLVERVGDIHLAAAMAARPEPIQFARDLFARAMDEASEAFGGGAERYADVLGKRGLAEYRRLAVAEWEKLARKPGRKEEISFIPDRLAGILDFFAEQEGDVDARIALRARDLSAPYRYLGLAEFCLEHGRQEQAIKYAEEGLWIFEDGRPDERLVLFAADLLVRSGRAPDAETHLWAAFEKGPSLKLYTQLRANGGDAAYKRATRWLEAQCARTSARERSTAADVLVEVLVQEREFNEAWAIRRRFGGSSWVIEHLVGMTEKTHPAEAVEFYAASVERLAATGVYPRAAELVVRMATLRDTAAQDAYIAALKERHGRKRNFMKLLK